MKQFFFLIAISSVFAAESFSADWPQWRGPQRDGRVSSDTAWPSRIGTNELKQIWRVDVSPSYSGPIVGSDRVFTTETRDAKFEVVRALDRSSGKLLWSTEWEGAMSVPFYAKSNGSWIRSTPALDDDRLYVAGMREVLVCLDARDGSEIWRKDFVNELKTPPPDFGFVCSPLVDGPAVFVQAGAGLAKLDKLTGEILWRSSGDKGGLWDSAFSSPIIAELGGMRQLVVQTREKLIGVNIDSGLILWEQPVQAFRGMNILTPVVHEDIVFTSTYGGKTIGFKVVFKGDAFVVEEAWRHKAQGYMSTPVVIDGIAYEHLKSQRLMAIDVTSGQEFWTSDQSFGKYMSLIANRDQVLALDQRGELFLLQANNKKLTILDQRKLTDDETWAHLAVAGDEIFVRELNGLTAYRWSAKESRDVATR